MASVSPLILCFSVWICRVGMLLSGLFRTLKERTYLSVTFINSGNSPLCFPLQLCSYQIIISMSLCFSLSQHYKSLTLCLHVSQSAGLSAHTGLQFYSDDDYFLWLHLINHWGSSAVGTYKRTIWEVFVGFHSTPPLSPPEYTHWKLRQTAKRCQSRTSSMLESD